MAKRRSRDLAVGAVFALGLIVLAVTVMAVGAESRLFSRKVPFIAVFPNTDGLIEGSPVKMAGVQVGTVLAIHLPTDPSRTGIEVTLGVDRDFAPRVRADSRVDLGVLQYLTGEKAVEITPGSPDEPELPPGSVIELKQSTELLEQVGVVSQNLAEITVSLRNVLGALERGEGLIGQMIQDPEFGREGIEALSATLKNLEALTGDLRQGKGAIGRLIQDEELGARLDDMGRALERFAALADAIDPERGAVGELLREDGAGKAAVEDLRAAAASLRRVAASLESPDGFVGKLLHDTAYSERLSRDLEELLRNAAEITGKINRGEGSLGALINERTVHDGLEDVVAGVNDSKFARWLLRHYQKKGIKSQDDTDPSTDEGEP